MDKHHNPAETNHQTASVAFTIRERIRGSVFHQKSRVFDGGVAFDMTASVTPSCGIYIGDTVSLALWCHQVINSSPPSLKDAQVDLHST